MVCAKGDTINFVNATIGHIENLAKNSIKHSKNRSICLTGGKTAMLLYENAAFQKLLFDRFKHFFWGDERLVPPWHIESNYFMATQTLLRTPFKNAKIHRIRGETLNLDDEISRYEKLLPSSFDLVLLSVGDDGHIASIFKQSRIIGELTRSLAYVANAPSQLRGRITITPKVILSARNVVVLVRGKLRGRLMAEALREPSDLSSLPARLTIGRSWIMDGDAHSEFSSASSVNLYGTHIICA